MAKIEKIIRILKNGKRNICYGAGSYGQQVLGFFRAHGLDIDYFVISNLEKNKKVCGVPVCNVNDIVNASEYNWIIGVSEKYVADIKNILKKRDIKPCLIIDNKDIIEIVRDALTANKEVHNFVSDEKRCFIMGTGGSLSSLNLKLLRNEDVFSCSFCSLLEDYEWIAPKYYILPALTGDWVAKGEMQYDYIRDKIAFYSKAVTSPLIFCDYNDRHYIQFYEGFKGKKIYYLYQTEKWDSNRNTVYDLCEATPTIQTGSIMMLKVAMYMGYKKIYLIGTEHDLVGRNYGHAYNLKKLKEWGFSNLLNIALAQNMYIEKQCNREKLNMSLNMYNEYYYLHNIAKQNGIQIFNATKGGSLDEFEKIEYELLF